MRRCEDTEGGGMMTRSVMAAVVSILLSIGTATAQWPAPAHQFDDFTRGNQVLSGACERASVCLAKSWTNSLPSATWYNNWFIQRRKLASAKTIINNCLTAQCQWIKPDTNNATPETWTVVTKSNLLAWVGAPTNYLDSTPWFNLASSSNGWMFMPSIQSNLVWLAGSFDYSVSVQSFRMAQAGITNNHASSYYYPWDASQMDTIPHAIAAAWVSPYYEHWGYTPITPAEMYIKIYNYGTWGGHDRYDANFETTQVSNQWVVSGSNPYFTNKTARAVLFEKSEAVSYGGAYTNIFSLQGYGLSNVFTVVQSQIRQAGTANGDYYAVGDISAQFSDYADAPSVGDTTYCGWREVLFVWMLNKFDDPSATPNGFNWFK